VSSVNGLSANGSESRGSVLRFVVGDASMGNASASFSNSEGVAVSSRETALSEYDVVSVGRLSRLRSAVGLVASVVGTLTLPVVRGKSPDC
jgi:hypothetical protein